MSKNTTPGTPGTSVLTPDEKLTLQTAAQIGRAHV